MFSSIYLSEIKRQTGSLPFYLYTAILFAGTVVFVLGKDPDSYIMGMNIGREWHNAPILIAKVTASYSVIGIFFTMIMAGNSVYRDFSYKIHDFYFTKPIRKSAYLGGRFFGSLSANLLIY